MKTLLIVLLLIVLLLSTPAYAADHLCRTATGKIETRTTCKPNEVVADVLEADDRMVESCTFVGEIVSSSGFGGMIQAKGLTRARRGAMKKAAEKNATHLVWTRAASGYGGANASGRAYRCEAKP